MINLKSLSHVHIYGTVNSYVPMNIFLSHANRSQIRMRIQRIRSTNSPISHTNIFLSGVRKKDYFRMRKEYFRMRKEYFRMIRNSDREARTPTPRSV